MYGDCMDVETLQSSDLFVGKIVCVLLVLKTVRVFVVLRVCVVLRLDYNLLLAWCGCILCLNVVCYWVVRLTFQDYVICKEVVGTGADTEE